MSAGLLYALTGTALFALGVGGLILRPHLLSKILAFNILGSGAFLALVGLGQRDGVTDPVPQAMVLTGIVVAVAATALALALSRRLLDISGDMVLPGERAQHDSPPADDSHPSPRAGERGKAEDDDDADPRPPAGESDTPPAEVRDRE